MRYLGVDYGRVRVGLAVAEAELGVATPLTAVPGGPKAAEAVAAVAVSERADAIVLGEPRSLSGARGPMADEVDRFREELAARTALPIHLADERYTSKTAERAFAGDKRARKRRKDGALDCAAASLLLSAWLEAGRR